MGRIFISTAARDVIEQILIWTVQEFGEEISSRYEELLIQAMQDLLEDPSRAGSTSRAELSQDARTYHLMYSRNRVSVSVGRIKKTKTFSRLPRFHVG